VEDHRQNARFGCDCPTVVKVLDPPLDTEVAARIVDVSKTGLRLFLETPVPPDAAVLLRLGDRLLLGEICYCHASNGRFDSGVRIEESFCENAPNTPANLVDIVVEASRESRLAGLI